jgi:hypothetical protein
VHEGDAAAEVDVGLAAEVPAVALELALLVHALEGVRGVAREEAREDLDEEVGAGPEEVPGGHVPGLRGSPFR